MLWFIGHALLLLFFCVDVLVLSNIFTNLINRKFF